MILLPRRASAEPTPPVQETSPSSPSVVMVARGRGGVTFASVTEIDGVATMRVQRAATVDSDNLPEATVIGAPTEDMGAIARVQRYLWLGNRGNPHLDGVNSKWARFVLNRKWERAFMLVTIIAFISIGLDCFILMLSRHRIELDPEDARIFGEGDIPLLNVTMTTPRPSNLPRASAEELYFDPDAPEKIVWTQVLYPPISIVYLFDNLVRIFAIESRYDEKAMHYMDLIITLVWVITIVIIMNNELFDFSVTKSHVFVTRLFVHIMFWSNSWRRLSVFVPYRNNRDRGNIPGQTPRTPVECVGTPLREPSFTPPESMVRDGTIIQRS